MPKKKMKSASRLLFLLSPAKTLNFSHSAKRSKLPFTDPTLIEDVDPLLKTLKKMKKPQLKKLLGVSDNINNLNYDRYQAFVTSAKSKNAKPVDEKFKQCILAYNGAAYSGLQACEFNDVDLSFCNDHLRIISGLYGILKPLDIIQPYRLDFGKKLAVGDTKNLYGTYNNIYFFMHHYIIIIRN